jgi:hypothetical protein
MRLATSVSAPPLTPAAFEARFSDLIELICDAAQRGYAKPFMEAQYTVLQAWMQENFPGEAAGFPPALRAEFERLFLPETLTSLLREDDGSLMPRLICTQEAIQSWKNTQLTS